MVETNFWHDGGDITTFNNQLTAISGGQPEESGKVEVLENELWDVSKIETTKDLQNFPHTGFTCLVVPSGLGGDYLYMFGTLFSNNY